MPTMPSPFSGVETAPAFYGAYPGHAVVPAGSYSGPGMGGSGGYPAGSALSSASATTDYNLNNAGNISEIANLINSINQSAQKSAQNARIPNNPALEEASSAMIGQQLKGQVPADVQRLLQQQAAERGVATGIGTDSANTSAAYLRALGLTSLQQQQAGQQNLTAAEARNPIAPLYDPSSLIITPTQGAQMAYQGGNLALQGYEAQQQAALQAAQLALRAAQGSQYSYPQFNYPTAATSTGNTLTAADLFPTDVYTPPAGGSGVTSSVTYPAAPFSSNFYDYTPSIPTEIGGAAGLDYATTPVSMYG